MKLFPGTVAAGSDRTIDTRDTLDCIMHARLRAVRTGVASRDTGTGRQSGA